MTKIATFVIPDNITSMGEGVMSGWTHLENITLPFIGESTSATGINGVFGYMFGKRLSTELKLLINHISIMEAIAGQNIKISIFLKQLRQLQCQIS